MARSDWSIERVLVRETKFADLPELTESMRIRHILTHKTIENLTKTFEQSYPTPSNEDLERRENNWIETLEKSYLVPFITLGKIETEPVEKSASKPQSNFARALRLVESANQSLNQLESSANTLKAAFPDESKTIDLMLMEARSEIQLKIFEARAELKK